MGYKKGPSNQKKRRLKEGGGGRNLNSVNSTRFSIDWQVKKGKGKR